MDHVFCQVKGKQLFYFLFGFLNNVALSNWVYSLRKEFAIGANLCPKEITHIEKGGINENDTCFLLQYTIYLNYVPELQIRGSTEDNSKTIFLISR